MHPRLNGHLRFVDWAAVGAGIGAWMEKLPEWAGVLSFIWLAILIGEWVWKKGRLLVEWVNSYRSSKKHPPSEQ